MRSLFVLLFFASFANCYKILCVFPLPSRSHYYVGHALMKGLAEDGHQVTIVSPFQQKKPIENYTEVLLEHSWTRFERGDLGLIQLNRNFIKTTNFHY